ncbi:MAG TPA: sigma-70 family RNA polymerase sigma factor [Lacipirellulaceae bacterium]|nr:sigma-70 family RNA polymerase sigma factor [Lacipirellulaceae bacterium]
MTDGPPEDLEALSLVEQAIQGDSRAWRRLVEDHRDGLRRMVALRMDRRLQGRIDPSDIIQESYIDAARRLPEYVANPKMPFFIWLRWLVGQRMMEQHRRHLGVQARDVTREVSLYQGAFPEATTADLATNLLGRLDSPSQEAIQVEQRKRLQEALDLLEPIDREVLVLRHFEQLSNGETAEVLNLDKSAASKRYTRALLHLKSALIGMPGGLKDVLI